MVADSLLNDSGIDFEIIYEDSKAQPQQAVSAINKLVSADKVHIIIGDMFTSTTLATRRADAQYMGSGERPVAAG